MTNAREATHLTNVAEDLGSDDRADPEQLGQRGFRRPQGEGQVPLESPGWRARAVRNARPHPARIGDDRRRIAADERDQYLLPERWVERATTASSAIWTLRTGTPPIMGTAGSPLTESLPRQSGCERPRQRRRTGEGASGELDEICQVRLAELMRMAL